MAEGLPAIGVKVSRRGFQRQVHAFQPGADRQIGKGDAERRMGGHQIAHALIPGHLPYGGKKDQQRHG